MTRIALAHVVAHVATFWRFGCIPPSDCQPNPLPVMEAQIGPFALSFSESIGLVRIRPKQRKVSELLALSTVPQEFELRYARSSG